MNFKLILEAWMIAHDPTSEQIELSEKRAMICDTCEFRKEMIKKIRVSNICTKCGCPIVKKVFTNTFNPCPMEKWNEIDLEYFKDEKLKKTLL